MSLWGALSAAWSVGRDVEGAVAAARTTLAVGGSPVDALRAFAAASDNQLDDTAVTVLEDVLRKGIAACRAVVAATAWVAEHEDDVRRVIDSTVSAAVSVGYAAGRWRRTLDAWSA